MKQAEDTLRADSAAPVNWHVLHAPAAVWRSGHVIDRSGRWALAQLTRGAVREMGAAVGRPIDLSPWSLAGEEEASPVWGVHLAMGPSGPQMMLSLDLAAALAICNAMTGQDGGVMLPTPPGPASSLGEAEHGLLEYAALRTLDGMNALASTVTVRAFADAAGVDAMTRRAEVALTATLRLGGVEGRIWLDAVGVASLHEAVGEEPADGPDHCSVRLALPTIPLRNVEVRAMEIGDVLMFDGPRIGELAGRSSLMTTTHWTLADATVRDDDATFVSVEPGPIWPHVSPRTVQPWEDRIVYVQPWLGESDLRLSALSAWQPGQMLRLSKDGDAPVRLGIGPAEVGSGELVILEGLVGVRVLAWDLSHLTATEDSPPSQAEEST